MLKRAQTSLKPYERALYGALGGEVDAVLLACETWEDHLWAHALALLTSELDRRMAECDDGRFWLEGQRQADKRNAVDVKQALQDAFERLQESSSKAVRSAATHPLRIAQRYLVLGQIDRLFDEFSTQLEARANDLPEECVVNPAAGSRADLTLRETARLIRFHAHLALFLRKLEQPLPASTYRILEAYARVLEKHEMSDLIAYYASQLDAEEAVETYAAVLQRAPASLLATAALLMTSHRPASGADVQRHATRTAQPGSRA